MFACCWALQKALDDSLLYTHAHRTHTCELFMFERWQNAMASTKPMKPAQTSLKATVWQQFVRCVELNLNTSATQLILKPPCAIPPRIGREAATCCWCQPENDRAGSGTASTKLWGSKADYHIHCKCMHLRPYSAVENVGFRTMAFTLEPRYKIPYWCYFTNTAISTLYSETKTKRSIMC